MANITVTGTTKKTWTSANGTGSISLSNWNSIDYVTVGGKSTYTYWWKQYDDLKSLVASLNTPTTSTTATSTPKTTSTKNTTNTWMNSMSQSVAQNNSRNAQVGTGDVVDMPKQQTTSLNQTSSDEQFAKSWNSLTAAQQRNALTGNKQLTDYINSKWYTVKKEETPAQTTTTTTPKKTTTVQTPKQQQWDYQDNSQARMNEILNNLNGYRQTNPELFKDASAFYTFFIDGKGRSQDQINYLWDYYNNVQKFWKYDNMPASSLWDWLANWSIPKDYLDYLKSTDPNKYQEVLSYKQDSEDKIKYENYLDELSSMAWFESEKSDVPETSDPITYAKKMWYFVDENWDWVDDNLYVKPTDEERQDVDRINEINARRMEIKNMQKNLLDDLVEQYPWVPKATLMGIVQDRTKDISREYDDLWVELVQLQGTVDYLQNERWMQADARQQTINNLSKAYWMYYDYSPEWIAELAQSKYAATNITLDQADSWNETQKQIALQNVLDWYYAKYWDIIQRSEQQVINDVIAYAKKNWVWLAQALQENFVTPLQQKPQFASLSWGSTGLSWEKIGKNSNWDDVYWFVDLTNKTVTPYWSIWWTTSWWTTTYTAQEVSTNRDKRVAAMHDIANQYSNIWDMAEAIAYNMEWIGDWNLSCWEYVNDYINAVTWTKWWYGNSIASKKALATNKNWDDIQVWDAIVFDYNINTPQRVLNSDQKEDLLKYGHVGFVTGINPDGSINMSHTSGGVVKNTVIEPWSSFYNCFAWSQHITPSSSIWKWFNEQWTNEYLAFIKAAWNPSTQANIAQWLWLSVDEMREQANRYSWSQTADTYFDMLWRINNILASLDNWTAPSFLIRRNAMSDTWGIGWLSTLNPSVADRKADNDKIVDTLSLDSLINLKWRWATFWALSDSEREAIGRYATALGSPMSDEKYKYELQQLRKSLIEASHWYLWDLSDYWQNQSYDWAAWI